MTGWRELAAAALSETAGGAIEPETARVPTEWDDALKRLRAMSRPRIAGERRWRQIIEDAAVFVSSWGDVAPRLGWTIADVFAFDLDEQSDALGLIFAMRGGRVVLVDADSAIIRNGGRRSVFYRGRCDQAPLVWHLEIEP